MASSSSTGKKIQADTTDEEHTEVEDEEDESLEHFDDFTLASSWERFISEIEAVCRLWMSDGPKNLLEKGAVLLEYSGNLYKVTSETKYAMKSYCMEYYFETNPDGKPADWNFDLHDLQLCFGVKEFLVIAPQSASGVVLDAPEAVCGYKQACFAVNCKVFTVILEDMVATKSILKKIKSTVKDNFRLIRISKCTGTSSSFG